jgi:peptidoglycan/xylan/chitin deacetylase (PgdA/CDA1 family)
MGTLNSAVETLDRACANIQLRFGERRGRLITIFVHNLFLDASEIERNLAYPQQCLTVGELERALKYFQSVGYRFVSPSEIIQGLNPAGKHVLLTFDDGYFNNQRALPLMESYGVPALFFVPAGMIRDGKAYWLDQVYRTRRQAGRSQVEAFAEIEQQTGRRTEDVEKHFLNELGVREFRAVSDVDRLFTPQELRTFAAHPLVFIGNHGCYHEFLPAYSLAEARRVIVGAQELIQEITGKPSLAIAYPCGAFSNETIALVREAGLRLGFATEARKDGVSRLFEGDRAWQLGRHTLWGSSRIGIEKQCEFMRSDIGLHYRYRRMIDGLKRRNHGA